MTLPEKNFDSGIFGQLQIWETAIKPFLFILHFWVMS
jgi:hypothetical protein